MITKEEMRELENISEQKGISKMQLMENAGRGIYDVLNQKFELKNKKILVVCYHGNNGGDGFVAASYLSENSDVTVLFIGDESKLKKEAELNYKRIDKDFRIQIIVDPEEIDFDDFDIILDAMLGTGVVGTIGEPILSIIGMINDSKATKVAVDMPTGFNPDAEDTANLMVNPDIVITFHDMKKGMEAFDDKTVVVDIGIKK